MDNLRGDLRFVTRTLLRSPGFLLVSVLTLALGIGATTAIFTVVNGVLLRPLPYPHAERIVRLWEVGSKGGRMNASDPDFEDLRAGTRSFEALAQVADYGVVSVTGAHEAVRAHAALVSKEFFRVMGVSPVRGRLFTADEQREGGAPAVVVSEAFWRGSLGGAPIGQGLTLSFDNRVYTVVGIMPAELDYPAGNALWVPRELEPRNPHRTGHNWQVLGRLAPNVSLDQARSEVRTVAHRIKQQYGDEADMVDAALVPLHEQMVGHLRPALLVLLAASAMLLAIACANVVNLVMARVAAREGELALRLALGATRTRLVQQFVTEALVLAGLGGVLGILLAAGGVRALLALQSGNLPRLNEIHVSWPVLLFALGVSVLAALTMGLLTAWRSGRGDLRATLAQSQRMQGTGGSLRLRSALVVAQVAGTLVLLVGAGLLGRSFLNLLRVDPGFRTERTLVLDLSTPKGATDAEQQRTVRFYDDLMARLRTIPGVREVGGVNVLPLDGRSAGDGNFLIMSRPDELLTIDDFTRLMRDPSRTGHAQFRVASGGYFRALGIPLIRGRLFDDRDAPNAPHAAVISQSLATKRWPNEDPLGKVIQFGNMDGDLHPFTIVGVVGDVREAGLAEPPRPTFYAFYRQRPRGASVFNIVLQGNVESPSVIAAAREAVRTLRPDIPPRFRTIETVVSASIADRRFTLLLIGIFGGAALALAVLGVYGVISYLTTQRRPEIGVRIALGAQTGDVLRLVLREGVLLALGGILVGGVAALLLTRLLAGLLFGVSPTDPVSFGVVTAGLVGVVLLASLVPARRAARVDPMSILRGG
jgi:predicted permease